MLVEPRRVDQPLLDQDRAERGEQPRIAPGSNLEMKLRELGRFRAARIDDDDRSLRVLRDVPQREPRVREAVRLPWILADEDGDFAPLEITADRRTEHQP